jgi:hypothetical protein
MSRLPDHLQPPVIEEKIVRYECPKCGNNCQCGVPYVPKTMRAAEAVKAHPEKSNRMIAEEIGVHPSTVDEARKQLPGDPAVEKRTGLDGKARQMPQPAEPKPVDEGDLIVKLHNGPITEIRHGLQQLSPAARERLRGMALRAWHDARLNEQDEILF